MSKRFTKRDLNAISEALIVCLAGEWDEGDGRDGAPSEELEAALDKVTDRLHAITGPAHRRTHPR